MGSQSGATGYVNWPEGLDGWRASGEGGMWVAAFWLCELGEDDQDPFVRCHGPEYTIALPFPDSVATALPADRLYRDDLKLDLPWEPEPTRMQVEQHAYDQMDAAHPVLAAVVLGTSAICWSDGEGNYWSATTEELTSRGRALVVALNALYDRQAIVVTYLDT